MPVSELHSHSHADRGYASLPTAPASGCAPLGPAARACARADAPVSNQTINQKQFVTHRAATRALPPSPGLRSVPHRSAFFLPAAAEVREETSRNARKGKTMKLDEVSKRTKEAVDFLIAALEFGHSEVLTADLGAMARSSPLSTTKWPAGRCF